MNAPIQEKEKYSVLISYSNSDPLSKFLCDLAEELLREMNFDVERFKDRSGQSQFDNCDQTAYQESIRVAQQADVTVAIVLRNYGGGFVAADSGLIGADGTKTICRHEFEESQRAGKHAIALVEGESFAENIEDRDEDVFFDGIDKTHARRSVSASNRQANRSPDSLLRQRNAHEAFISSLSNAKNVIHFEGLHAFRQRLRGNLRKWVAERTIVASLPNRTELFPSRQRIVDAIFTQLPQSGAVVVAGHVAVGTTQVAVHVGWKALDSGQFRRVLFVDCRKKKAERIVREICRIGRFRKRKSHRSYTDSITESLRQSRNLVILDAPSATSLEQLRILLENTTYIVVASERRVIDQAKSMHEPFLVQPLRYSEVEQLIKEWLPYHQQLEPNACTSLARIFSSMPSALRAACTEISQDHVSSKPVARFVEQMNSAGFNPGETFLARLPAESLDALAVLSRLPDVGFTIEMAAVALDKSEAEVSAILNRLVDRLLIKKDRGDQLVDRWRLERGPMSIFTEPGVYRERQEQARKRLTDFVAERLTQYNSSAVLPYADPQVILELMIPHLLESPVPDKRKIAIVSNIAKRTGRWRELSKLLIGLLESNRAEFMSSDLAYYLWQTSQALDRSGDRKRSEQLCREAIQLVGDVLDRKSSKFYTTLASNLTHQGRPLEAVPILRRVLSFESLGYGKRGIYITQHLLARALWFANERSESIAMIETSIAGSEVVNDLRHLSEAYVTRAETRSLLGHLDEALDDLQRAAKAAEQLGRSHQLALISYRAGLCWARKGNLVEAKNSLMKARAICKQRGRSELEFEIHIALIDILRKLQEVAGLEELTELANQEQDCEVRARLLFPLVVRRRGERALGEPDRVLLDIDSIDRLVLTPHLRAILSDQQGQYLLELNRLDDAVRILDEAYQASKHSGNRKSKSIAALSLAVALERSGDVHAAIRLLQERLDDPECELLSRAKLCTHLGMLFKRLNRLEAAATMLTYAVECEEALPGHAGSSVARPLHQLAIIHHKQGKTVEGERLLRSALKAERSKRNRKGEMFVLHSLAILELDRGRFSEAEQYLAMAMQLDELRQDPRHEVRLLHTKARLASKQGVRQSAIELLSDSLKISDSNLADKQMARHSVLSRIELAELLPSDSGLIRLKQAAATAKDCRLWEEFLTVAGRLARLEDNATDAGAKDAAQTLRDAIDLGLDTIASLHTTNRLQNLISQFAALYRRRGEVHESRKYLESVRSRLLSIKLQHGQLSVARLNSRVAEALGQLLAETDRTAVVYEAPEHYRRACEEALEATDYAGFKRLLLDWAIMLAKEGDLQKAADHLGEYLLRISMHAPPSVQCALVSRRAEFLARLHNRLFAANRESYHSPTDDRFVHANRVWFSAYMGFYRAERFARKAGLRLAESDAVVKRAAILLDRGYARRAKELIEHCMPLVIREWDTPEPIDGLTESSRGKLTIALQLAEVMARVSLNSAIDLLGELAERLKHSTTMDDFVLVIELMFRLQIATRPWSCQRAVDAAYNFAFERQNREAMARFLKLRSKLRQRFGDLPRANELLREAVDHLEQLGNGEKYCDALRRYSRFLHVVIGDKEAALSIAQKALKGLEGTYGWRRVRIQNSIAKLYRELEKYSEAEQVAREGLETARGMRSSVLEASAHLTLAAIEASKHETDKAIVSYSTAMELVRFSPTQRVFRYALSSLASLRYRTRDIPSAIANSVEFLNLAEALGYPLDEVFDVKRNLAKAFRQAWLPGKALEVVTSTISQMIRDDESAWLNSRPPRWGQLRQALRLERALILQTMNRLEEAERELLALDQERAQSNSMADESLEFHSTSRIVLISLAKINAKLGKRDESELKLAASQQLLDDDPRQNTIFHLDLAFVRQYLGDLEAANQAAIEALRLSDRIVDPYGRVIAQVSGHMRLSSLARAKGEFHLAHREAELARGYSMQINSIQLRIVAEQFLALLLFQTGNAARAAQTAKDALILEQKLTAGLATQSTVSTAQVALNELAAMAFLEAGERDQSDAHRETAETGRRQLAISGLLLPDDLDEVIQTVTSDAMLGQQSIEPPPVGYSVGDTVCGVVKQIRSDGDPRGVVVALANNVTALLAERDAYGGLRGDLHLRYSIGQSGQFRILSLPHANTPTGEITLAPSEDPTQGWKELDGKIVPATILDFSHLTNQKYVVIQIVSGERIEMPFPGDGGWGTSKVEAQLWTEKEEIYVRLSLSGGLLTASICNAILPTMERLRDSRRPIAGEIVRRDDEEPRGVWVRLAPAVIAFCPEEDCVTDSRHFRHLKPGHTIAVELRSVQPPPLGITVSRMTALKTILGSAKRRIVFADVMGEGREGKRMLGFGPGIVGLGTPPKDADWRNGQRVTVRVDGKHKPHFIRWETVGVDYQQQGTSLESAPNLLDCVEDVTHDDNWRHGVIAQPSSDKEETLLSKYRDFDLQPYQSHAIRCIENGDNLILWAPTGSGKTLVAEWAIDNVRKRHKRAMFASPVKALSNQKFYDFKQAFGPENVGLVTGDVEINPLAPILIVTTEILRNRAIETPESLQHFHLAVFDEIHYMDDEKRGTAWEEAIIMLPSQMQIVALSATIPNSDALVRWMRTARPERPVQVVPETRMERPVKLVHHFCTANQDGLNILGNSSEVPSYMLGNPSADSRRGPPMHGDSARNMLRLVEKIQSDGLPAIFFCPRQDLCEAYSEELATMCGSLVPREVGDAAVAEFNKHLQTAGHVDSEAATRLRELARVGIAYHHAGLLPGLKMAVESLFRDGRIQVVFATDTFAVGVNMPARSVILSSLNKGSGKKARALRYREFAQMSGRAGRLSRELRDNQGDVYAFIRRGDFAREELVRYEKGPFEKISSHFDPDYRTLINLRFKLEMTLDQFWDKSFAASDLTGPEATALKQRMTGKWRVLELLGYVDADRLSESGGVCAQIADQEIAVTEAYVESNLSQLSPIQLAAFMGSVACHHASFAVRDTEAVIPDDWWQNLNARLNRAIAFEQSCGVTNYLRKPIRRIEPIFQAWAGGASFQETLSLLQNKTGKISVTPGTLVMWIRQSLQIITSLINAIEPNSPGFMQLMEAKSLMQRDEVVNAITFD